MKQGADNLQTKLQAKAEIAGFKSGPSDKSGIGCILSLVVVCCLHLFVLISTLLASLPN